MCGAVEESLVSWMVVLFVLWSLKWQLVCHFKLQYLKTRASSVRITHIGWPRAAYIATLKAKGPGRSRSMNPFSIQVDRITRCLFDAILVILVLIHYKLSRGQAKFPSIWVKMVKMNLKVKANDPIFNTNRKYPGMHLWCKFDYFSQMTKITFKAKVNDRCFQYPPRVSHDAYLVQMSQMIPAQICVGLSCGQDKVYGRTNTWTARRTQATIIPLPPQTPRGK